MSQQPVRIDPNQPYVLLGYQLQEALSVLQEMPRSTDRLCKMAENVLLSAQVLQTAPQTPAAPATTVIPPTL